MNKLKIWSQGIKRTINKQKENIYKRDFKFFKIDRLEKIAERIDEYSDNCEECENLKKEVEHISNKLSEYINGSLQERSEYEKRSEIIVKHLKDKHGLISPGYYSAVYSLAGFSAGISVFTGIAYLINPVFWKFGLLIGFTLGIIAGRIYGNKKDKQKKNAGLIL